MATHYLTRRVHFNAAHRIHNPEKSDEWNRRAFGKCNNPNGHGHNYQLEVTIAGEPDPDTGYVLDLGQLKRIVEERVLSRCDHKHLNLDVDFMAGINPTSENFIEAIWKQLEGALPRGRLHALRLFETEHNIVEYRGP